MKSIPEILADIRPEFDFTASHDFIADGMLDSFDVMTLVAELDKQFGVSIDGLDILPENFGSVEAIRRILRKNGARI